MATHKYILRDYRFSFTDKSMTLAVKMMFTIHQVCTSLSDEFHWLQLYPDPPIPLSPHLPLRKPSMVSRANYCMLLSLFVCVKLFFIKFFFLPNVLIIWLNCVWMVCNTFITERPSPPSDPACNPPESKRSKTDVLNGSAQSSEHKVCTEPSATPQEP